MMGINRPGRPLAQAEEKNQFEPRSISLPIKLWKILERLQKDRMDAALSSTMKALLLTRLAEMQYLNEEEKKALGI